MAYIEVPDELYEDIQRLIKDKGAENAPPSDDIDKLIAEKDSNEYVEYWGEEVTVKRNWQSSPDHPETFLAYITVAEAKLLRSLGLGYSNRNEEQEEYTQHYDRKNIPSFNGWGEEDSDPGGSFGGLGDGTSSEGESEASGGGDGGDSSLSTTSGEEEEDYYGTPTSWDLDGNGLNDAYERAVESLTGRSFDEFGVLGGIIGFDGNLGIDERLSAIADSYAVAAAMYMDLRATTTMEGWTETELAGGLTRYDDPNSTSYAVYDAEGNLAAAYDSVTGTTYYGEFDSTAGTYSGKLVDEANALLQAFGVEVVDVHIKTSYTSTLGFDTLGFFDEIIADAMDGYVNVDQKIGDAIASTTSALGALVGLALGGMSPISIANFGISAMKAVYDIGVVNGWEGFDNPDFRQNLEIAGVVFGTFGTVVNSIQAIESLGIASQYGLLSDTAVAIGYTVTAIQLATSVYSTFSMLEKYGYKYSDLPGYSLADVKAYELAMGLGDNDSFGNIVSESEIAAAYIEFDSWMRAQNPDRYMDGINTKDVYEYMAGGALHDAQCAGSMLFDPTVTNNEKAGINFKLNLTSRGRQSIFQENAIYKNLLPITDTGDGDTGNKALATLRYVALLQLVNAINDYNSSISSISTSAFFK